MTAGEDSVERVIVLRRNRIKLVIVTAGASDGQPHRASRHHVDAIIDNVGLIVQKAPAQG